MAKEKTFEDTYNLACGVVGKQWCDTEQEFEDALYELENDPDMTFLGQFDMTQDIDEELEYQGFSLDEITKMSLNRYGNVLEVLHAPNTDYYAFIGAR